MKYIILIFFSFVSNNKLKAQTLNDPIYLNFNVFPSTDIGNNDERMSIQTIEAKLTSPIVNLGKKVQWINAVYYRYSAFDFHKNTTQESQLFNHQLHDLRYSIILKANISERFEFLSISRILFRSNLQERLVGNDFFPFALLLGNYAIGGNKDFTVGLGVALNSDFRNNSVIPVAAVRYENDKFKLELVYPNLNLLYKKSSSLEFGLFANVDGSISHIGQNNFNNENYHFQRNFQLIVAPTISFRIHRQIFGHIKAGLIPISNYQLLDINYQEVEAFTRELEPSLFLRTGVSFRLKK